MYYSNTNPNLIPGHNPNSNHNHNTSRIPSYYESWVTIARMNFSGKTVVTSVIGTRYDDNDGREIASLLRVSYDCRTLTAYVHSYRTCVVLVNTT